MITVFGREDAAEALGVSVETLDKYREKGKLAYRKIGTLVKFTEGDLVAFLDRCVVPVTRLPSGREKLEMAKRATGGGREDTD